MVIGEPQITAVSESYIVAYKPAGMHCAPLRESDDETLLAWCARLFPELRDCIGRKDIEGGLVHRIDRDTEGLVLFARTQTFMDTLLCRQEKGDFIKEYRALCTPLPVGSGSKGFPPSPQPCQPPFPVESAFRPYGPGRKAVRPVIAPYKEDCALDRGRPYRTTILELYDEGPMVLVRTRLERGFRHQVRCHLAWLGLPIASDALYGGIPVVGLPLGLTASALEFFDPQLGKRIRYEVESKSGSGGKG